MSGHTTIGTSDERARLREENERAYEESVRTNMDRERAARESEGKNASSNSLGPIMYEDAEGEQEFIELMNKRKEKTPKEPDKLGTLCDICATCIAWSHTPPL